MLYTMSAANLPSYRELLIALEGNKDVTRLIKVQLRTIWVHRLSQHLPRALMHPPTFREQNASRTSCRRFASLKYTIIPQVRLLGV